MRSFADAQATSSMTVAFVERHRGQEPLNFDNGAFNVRRFATRALACGERVRYLINDFPKIVDKIPDDRGWNRGKPGVNRVTLQRGCSASLRICLQSSYSRMCGGYRRLPSDRREEGKSHFIYLLVMNDTISSASGIFSVWRMVLLRW